MIFAISAQGPDATSLADLRFGRARYFRIVDCATGEQTVLDNEAGLDAAQGAGIQAVQRLANSNVRAVLTGQVGPKASRALQEANIAVYAITGGTVEEAIKAFMAGEVQLPNVDSSK